MSTAFWIFACCICIRLGVWLGRTHERLRQQGLFRRACYLGDFRCPRCGGRYFSTTLNGDLAVARWHCASTADGCHSLSENIRGLKACGWSSSRRQECMVAN